MGFLKEKNQLRKKRVGKKGKGAQYLQAKNYKDPLEKKFPGIVQDQPAKNSWQNQKSRN